MSPADVRAGERSRSRLFQPFPLGRGGRVMPNRIWPPAMVTWRGTGDGHVTDSIREIYRRYAEGGAGMIVLEATGIRDVRSGPLLRLSHDRFVPGLTALVDELRTLSPSLVVPQIIDFLKISTRKPTRAFMEGAVSRGRLPESVLALSDAEFEADHERLLPDPRARRDFLRGYRQQIEDLDESEILRIAGSPRRPRVRRSAGSTVWSSTSPHAYTVSSFLSVTNARRDRWGGSFENRIRLPLAVVRAVREAVGEDFVVGCRYPGSDDILGEDARISGDTLDDAKRIGVALARAGLDFLSVSRGGRFEDAKQPAVGEAAYPYTGHSGHRCIPRRKGEPAAVNAHLAAGIREAVRTAGLETPVVVSGRISTFDVAESLLREEKADLVGMARALLADPDLPRKWRSGHDDRVRACVFCPWCEREDQHHRVVTCTLWPRTPGDRRGRLTPAVWRPDTPV